MVFASISAGAGKRGGEEEMDRLRGRGKGGTKESEMGWIATSLFFCVCIWLGGKFGG